MLIISCVQQGENQLAVLSLKLQELRKEVLIVNVELNHPILYGMVIFVAWPL